MLPKEAAELSNASMAVIQQLIHTHNTKIMSDPALAALQMSQGALPHQQAAGMGLPMAGQPPAAAQQMMMNPMMQNPQAMALQM